MEKNIHFVITFILLRSLSSKAFQTDKASSGLRGNCIVRDGRDGIPGQPGIAGAPGRPGRDGRDCIVSWSLNRIFEMEKRLHDLDSKSKMLVEEKEKTDKKIEKMQRQIQQLFNILAAQNVLTQDVTDQETTIELPLPKDDSESSTATSDFIMSVQKTEEWTTRSPPTNIPIGFSSMDQSTKTLCKKRVQFHTHDQVETKGASNVDAFQLGGEMFLAIANYHAVSEGFGIDSYIYKMNPQTERFEFFQTLPTVGCRALTYFNDRVNSYLVAVNHFDGSTHEIDSMIYKWNGSHFESHVNVRTYGASAAQFFKINREQYLVFANYRNNKTVLVHSVIYKWMNGKLNVFQKLQTHGAVDCKFYRSKTGAMFLVFANFYMPPENYNVKSMVFKWDGRRFIFWQSIQTTAAMAVDFVDTESDLFLVIASYRTENDWHSDTNLYRWNGTSFVLFQELETTGATKVHHFFHDGSLYLAIPNYYDEITYWKTHSLIYKFTGGRFVKFQGIATLGAYDLQPFSFNGMNYLAAAFRFNGTHEVLQSKIYKLHNACVQPEDALP